jgi:hypothetical protein
MRRYTHQGLYFGQYHENKATLNILDSHSVLRRHQDFYTEMTYKITKTKPKKLPPASQEAPTAQSY